jgi:hypothetical protein
MTFATGLIGPLVVIGLAWVVLWRLSRAYPVPSGPRRFLRRVREWFLSFALPWMRWIEAFLTGVYGATVVALVAVLASAAPNIFAEEVGTRCWASALTTASLVMAETMLLIIAGLVVLFGAARFVMRLALPVGLPFWALLTASAVLVLVDLLNLFGFVLANSTLPVDQSDRVACGQAITHAPIPPMLIQKIPEYVTNFMEAYGRPGG